jgi:hypothetical protein
MVEISLNDISLMLTDWTKNLADLAPGEIIQAATLAVEHLEDVSRWVELPD